MQAESKKLSDMKIVILDGYTANPGDLSWKGLEELGTLTVYDRTRPEETVARAADAEIVLTNKVIISREVMVQLPQLKYIGVLATGYNVVDINAAHERGIIVTNVPAYSTESVAQMVFAHLLNVSNRVDHYATQNRQQRWSNDVWIGQNATILPGVHIGDGAIIGANAFVAKDVPPYAVVVGNPAVIKKYRFDKETIDLLLELKWWDKDIEEIKKLIPLLTGDLENSKIELKELLK